MKLPGTRSRRGFPTAANRSSSAAQTRREHPPFSSFWVVFCFFFVVLQPLEGAMPGRERCRAWGPTAPRGHGSAPARPLGVGVNFLGHVKGSGLVRNITYRQELSAASSSLSCISCLGVCVWGL